jgi:hypothetical protein
MYESAAVKSTKRFVPWRSRVHRAVAWLYNCYVYRDTDSATIVFTGDSFDVFMAVEMYRYLIKSIERLAKQNVRKNAKAKFRRSYKFGLADRLYDRIIELGQACSWAPERENKINAVSEFVEKNVTFKTPMPIKKIKFDRAAFVKGISAADGISLARQTTGSGGRYIGGTAP